MSRYIIGSDIYTPYNGIIKGVLKMNSAIADGILYYIGQRSDSNFGNGNVTVVSLPIDIYISFLGIFIPNKINITTIATIMNMYANADI